LVLGLSSRFLEINSTTQTLLKIQQNSGIKIYRFSSPIVEMENTDLIPHLEFHSDINSILEIHAKNQKLVFQQKTNEMKTFFILLSFKQIPTKIQN
jgi:hypothetical protein